MSEKMKKTKASSKVPIDTEAVKTLAALFKETDLTDIEYEVQGCRIRVSRNITMGFPTNMAGFPAIPSAVMPASHGPAPTSYVAEDAKSVFDPEIHAGAVRSPMVGTAYLSPKPGAANFVEVGAEVKEGQTLMIIEAMKVMNPLKASRSGKVTHILIEDAHPVEYDQVLFIIE